MVGGFGQAVCHTQYDGKEPLFLYAGSGIFQNGVAVFYGEGQSEFLSGTLYLIGRRAFKL